jgi:hypothetical protein
MFSHCHAKGSVSLVCSSVGFATPVCAHPITSFTREPSSTSASCAPRPGGASPPSTSARVRLNVTNGMCWTSASLRSEPTSSRDYSASESDIDSGPSFRTRAPSSFFSQRLLTSASRRHSDRLPFPLANCESCALPCTHSHAGIPETCR